MPPFDPEHYEEPPELPEEDEKLLDEIWDRIGREEKAKRRSSAPPDAKVE